MQGQNGTPAQLWDAGPVKQISRSHKRGAPPVSSICREPGCNKPRRLVQGARYCEDHARSIGYIIQDDSPHEEAICKGCTQVFKRVRMVRAHQSPADRAWREFCQGCTAKSPLTLKRLRCHNVSYSQVCKWLGQGDQLSCQFPGCGRRLSRDSMQTTPHLDHDHTCCPGPFSCGNCIRGVICTGCNTAAGFFEKLLRQTTVAAIDAYLVTIPF